MLYQELSSRILLIAVFPVAIPELQGIQLPAKSAYWRKSGVT